MGGRWASSYPDFLFVVIGLFVMRYSIEAFVFDFLLYAVLYTIVRGSVCSLDIRVLWVVLSL